MRRTMPRSPDPAPRGLGIDRMSAASAKAVARRRASRRTLAWADARGTIVGARCELPLPREARRAHARRRTLDLRCARGRLAPHLRRRGAGRGGSASSSSSAASEAPVGSRQPVPAPVDRRRPFDLDYLRRASVRPGRTVRARAGRGSRAVPPARPNEAPVGLYVFEDLSEDRTAVLLKIHHAMADGIGNMMIASALFDLTADAPMGEPDGHGVGRTGAADGGADP